MTDPQVDELLADLDRALAIEPSPSVAARVRTSLAGDADARWPVLQWRRIAVGAAALLVVAVVVRPWSDEPPDPSPRPVAAAAVKPVAEPVAAAVAVPAAAPAPRVSEPPPVAARAEASREPEVIVSPSQRLALDQLAAAVRNGRITADSFPDPDEDEPRLLDVVQITPIVLDVVRFQPGPAGGDGGGVIRGSSR